MISLGLDVGSIFTKAVLLDQNKYLTSAMIETSGNISSEMPGFIDLVLAQGGLLRADLKVITSTGQGEELVEEADYLEDEVACIAAASRKFLPEVELTVQAGGQGITAVLSNIEGEVLNYIRNDKCASGTGRFIEVITAALGIKIEEFDRAVERAEDKVAISTQCAVFAESEIISYVNQGIPVPDIIAGVCESTARIILSQALRFGAVSNYTLTGGVCAYQSIISILKERLPGAYHPFPIDPFYAGAYGAALLGQQE